jgi:hypothetical protein
VFQEEISQLLAGCVSLVRFSFFACNNELLHGGKFRCDQHSGPLGVEAFVYRATTVSEVHGSNFGSRYVCRKNAYKDALTADTAHAKIKKRNSSAPSTLEHL